LITNKGSVSPSEKNTFLADLESLLLSKRTKSSESECSFEDLPKTPPRVNHRRFNMFSVSAKKPKRKARLSKFAPKEIKRKVRAQRSLAISSVKRKVCKPKYADRKGRSM
jgi:hypothetical protein